MSLQERFRSAVELHRAGQFAADEALYRELVAADPRHADAWQLWGTLCCQQQRHAEAVEYIQQALKLGIRHPHVLSNLGAAYRGLGDDVQAIHYLDESLRADPTQASTWNNLANSLKNTGKIEEARQAYQKAIEYNPQAADAHDNLARLYQAEGNNEQAVQHFRRTLEIDPNNPRAHNNLGTILLAYGWTQEALGEFDTALSQSAEYGRAWNNRGAALRELGRPVEAVEAFRRARQFEPTLHEAVNNLGETLGGTGQVDEGLRVLAEAVDMAPHEAAIHSNRLMMLQYRPGITLAELDREHRHWAELHTPAHLPIRRDWPQSFDPARKLRIGIVSGDLGRHPVGCIVLPLVRHVDRSACELWLYSSRAMHDPIQQELRKKADSWCDAFKLNDTALAERIAADRIDILIDMSGHTALNRQGVFTRRSAPVQVTWAGYQSTTGVSAMDYLLTDATMVPREHEPFFSEEIVRLPESAWCCSIESVLFDPGLPPMLERGAVTFGSFNNAAKVNPQVVSLWSRVLAAVPGSRLILKYRGFGDPALAQHFQTAFAAHGIAPAQIECFGQTPFEQMLEQYRTVDIALDPFPFGGGMTSLISLAVGVPVVTLPGETLASRQTLSMLTQSGDPRTVARTADEYVAIAQALASDPTRLAELRQTWPAKIQQTAFVDPQRFVPGWLHTLQQLWARRCAIR